MSGLTSNTLQSQPSELKTAFSFALVKAVKVVIYDDKILSSLNFRLVLLNFLNKKKNKSRIFYWNKDGFFLKHSLFPDAGALSLNQGEKTLSSPMTFFSYPEQKKQENIVAQWKSFICWWFDKYIWCLKWHLKRLAENTYKNLSFTGFIGSYFQSWKGIRQLGCVCFVYSLSLYSIFFEIYCETHDRVNRISFVFAEVTNYQRLIYGSSFPGFLPLSFSTSYLCEGGCETIVCVCAEF